MLTTKYMKSFKKDIKRIQKRGYDTRELDKVIEMLATEQELPPKYEDHALIGDYIGCRECHITHDWLLIYEIRDQELLLYLVRTGTHSDVF